VVHFRIYTTETKQNKSSKNLAEGRNIRKEGKEEELVKGRKHTWASI
jgi:hypothetical protein